MPTPRSPSRMAAFARLIAPRTASWSNGWSETSVGTRTPRTCAGLHLRAAKRRLRLRSLTEKALRCVRDSFAKRSVVRPMTTSSGRPSKAALRRASWPAWSTSKVPPSTTRIWWTIRSARYKNDSGDQPAVADREEIGVDRIGGLSQSGVALDDLQLLQHVRPDYKRARRAVDGEQRMVRRDRFQRNGGVDRPALPPSAGNDLDPAARGPGGLDARGREGRDAFPANLLRSEAASHQDVHQQACLDRRVPAVQVHRRIRLKESHLASGRHALLVGPARLDLRQDVVARAVEDPLERLDAKAPKGLLEQVEDRRAVHDGPFVAESDAVLAGQPPETLIVVNDRTFVRGDYVLPAREGRHDMVHRNLSRRDPER